MTKPDTKKAKITLYIPQTSIIHFSVERCSPDLLLLPFLHLNSTVKNELEEVYWSHRTPRAVRVINDIPLLNI